MSSDQIRMARAAQLIGGWSLILATVLFAAEFSYLASAFDYPSVLDGTAADVLPCLLSLGDAGRAVWIVYGLTPLLLIPAALGVQAAIAATSPRMAKLALIAAALSAAAMAAGLLRWPSLHWQMAQDFAGASAPARESIAIVFSGLNSYLGTFVGEFLGELFLNIFFLCSALGLARASGRRWVAYAGSAAVVLGFIAMLRNATPLVAPLAAVNNAVLPLWMLILGVLLLRNRRF